MEIQQMAASIVGFIAPFAIQALRLKSSHIQKLGKKGVYVLAFVVTCVAVGLAYLNVDATPTLQEFMANAGMGFTLCQLTYSQIEEGLKEYVGDV